MSAEFSLGRHTQQAMPSPLAASPNARPDHVLIVGGGISGLAAAVRFASAHRPLRLSLVDAADRLGGLIATERTDGFMIEHGPDAVLAAKSAALELARRVGVADRMIDMRSRGSCVAARGRLLPLPEGMSGLLPARPGALLSTRLLSTAGKARVLFECLVRPRATDSEESIADFVRRRFGREMYERIAEPLLTGIFAGDGTRLSLDATFPRLRALEREHGSVLRGMLTEQRHARRRKSNASLSGVDGPRSSAFLSFRDGMAELPEGVARWLAATSRDSLAINIRLRAPATALLRSAEGASPVRVALAGGALLEADAIVLATPTPVSARLLAPHDAALGALLSGIEHASTAAVSLGFALGCVGRPLDASGYTVPRVEGRVAIACTWSSAKFPGRAPEGFALFRIFLGGVGREAVLALDDDELIACARTELAETVAVRGEPVIARVTRWPQAIPQYNVGHSRRRAQIEERVALKPWLALAGNAENGVGISDCIRSGERAAERILSWLAMRAQAVAPDNSSSTSRSCAAPLDEEQGA